jgi:replicative DNA helicase
MPQLLSEVSYLIPDHFYENRHQVIWKRLCEMENISLTTLTQKLKATGELEPCGGAYYLTKLSDQTSGLANMDYMGRIIQQMFIKREIIRISGEMTQKAFNLSTDPLDQFDEFLNQISSIEECFAPGQSATKMISGKENEMAELEIARQGMKFTGLSTGYRKLDEHFRFKPGSFVIINGHDNVGKSFVMIHLAVCSNRIHGWKWIMACMENAESRVRQDIIQSATGKHISQLTQHEFLSWYDWAEKNFILLRITGDMTAERLLSVGRKVQKQTGALGFFIDPYNALMLPKEKDRFFNSHEYHYEVTNKMRGFIKQTGCSIFLSTHAVTEALRQKHKDGDYAGFPMPPQKADVEGGGKFANRADDFLTIHRYLNHPTESTSTHIHVRKIKDVQTGGRPTVMDEPVKLRMVKGYFGLFDENGESPLVSTALPPLEPKRTLNPDRFHSDDDDTPF